MVSIHILNLRELNLLVGNNKRNILKGRSGGLDEIDQSEDSTRVEAPIYGLHTEIMIIMAMLMIPIELVVYLLVLLFCNFILKYF